MCYLKNEETRRLVIGVCIFYGLNFKESSTGLLVTNQANENFLLRLSKNGRTVRKVLHENHIRGFRKSEFDAEKFNREDINRLFHNQEVWDADGNPEKDVRRVLIYIANHGIRRKELEKFRRNAVRRILA